MLLTLLAWLRLLVVLIGRMAKWRSHRKIDIGYGRLRETLGARVCSATKPPWVRQEIMRLKALMPLAGCRTISIAFNRLFSAKRRMTVGKTFVSDVIRRHRYEIEVLRRHIKNHRPKPRSRCRGIWCGPSISPGRPRSMGKLG